MGKGGSWEKEDFFVFKNRDGGGEGGLRAIGEGIVTLATLRGEWVAFSFVNSRPKGNIADPLQPTMRISLVQEYFCDGESDRMDEFDTSRHYLLDRPSLSSTMLEIHQVPQLITRP